MGILQARTLEWVCHFLLQGIFPTQGSNPHLLHCRQIPYCLGHQGKGHYYQEESKAKNPKMTLYRSFPFLRKVILIMFLCHVTYCYMNGKLKYKTIIVTIQSQSTIENNRKDFPVIQWLRLHTPNAGGLGSIPSQGTRFHMTHPRISVVK